MSADNWAICPKCKSDLESRNKRAKDELNELYGKIPASDFINRRCNLDEAPQLVSHRALLENFEIGINKEGTFQVSYLARCSTCGYEFKFEHEQNTSAFK